MSQASSSIFDPTSIAGQSVRDLVDNFASSTPDQNFLIDPTSGETISYAQLQSDCRALASMLISKGYAQGDSIAYALPNGAQAAKIILGIIYGGFVATAVNLVSGVSTISHVLNHSKAKMAFVTPTTRHQLQEALDNTPCNCALVEIDNTWFNDETCNIPQVKAHEEGLLMYTSGTTGVPKGVVHTHESLLAGGSNTALAHQLGQRDRALCVLPLYHINGLCVTLLGALVSGSSLVVPHKFSVSTFWSLLRENQCTWFSIVPTQVSYLLHDADTNGFDKDGLEQLRFGRSASAPLAPEVQQAFETRFGIPIIETMGLTETAAQILSNPMQGTRKIGSPGLSYGNKVIIADDKQNECTRGTEGEVLVRGLNVMKEYRDNPKATAEALTKDGWLRTGDLGRMDEDGFIFITGRLKELIIKGGENIAPREIDEALYCHPDVIEAAAFAKKCTRYGETVEAAVMLKPGSKATAEQLRDLCREQIGEFKSPEQVHFMPELPKGPSGKIQRIKLVELFA